MITEEEIFKKYNKKDGEIHTSDWLLKQAIHEATVAEKERMFAIGERAIHNTESQISRDCIELIEAEKKKCNANDYFAGKGYPKSYEYVFEICIKKIKKHMININK